MQLPDFHLANIDQIRNLLAFFLVGSFVGALVTFTFVGIPIAAKDIITYMVGQLSGMATMALGYYFTNKIGQEQLDARRSETTGKLADAMQAVVNSTPAGNDPSAIRDGDSVEITKGT